MAPICVGGMEDHIHMLVRVPPALAVSQAVQLIKGPSSKWIHETFPRMGGFEWQDGYGSFAVSKSIAPAVIKYIKNQREHHRVKTFKEEFVDFLLRHEIEYKEEYLWD
jgi:REP element-mobilizing transposase RayT